MSTWYLYDKQTHGVEGLYDIVEMSETDIAAERSSEAPSVDPDVIIEGTRSQVIEWLQRNGCAAIETSDAELILRCPEWSVKDA
jgi:hypothetical protein